MTKKNKAKKITILLSAFILISSLLSLFFIFYLNRAYPNVYVAGIYLEGKSINNAIKFIESKINIPEKIILVSKDETFEIPTSKLNLRYNYEKSAKRAVGLGRSGNIVFDIQQISHLLTSKANYGLEFVYDNNNLDSEIATISAKITISPINPTFQISGNQLLVTQGKEGTKIDSQKLKIDIAQSLSQLNTSPIDIPIIQSSYDSESFMDNAVQKISKQLDTDPVNAKFLFENNHVQSFLPESSGTKVDTDKLKSEIKKALNDSSGNKIAIDLPLINIPASVKTSDVNSLGIKELIGSGTSHFAGSIASRIYNVNLAASRINNTLIPPGQVFSFDQTVGDISALNGYQQAYVIQNGQTVLGDGGGVCQVSTTMFRAAMNSGLPITERHAHAYRVHYYEEDAPPGMDATIYSPTVDFKFRNDTENFILIQTSINLRSLVLTFNLYGTKDGRISTITKPTLWDYKPAPADSYIDDPTLPLGQVKQIDFAATGIKSQFVYTVTKGGVEINKQTFYSNFEPWQAKFLRGTKV